jgi:hypothetical protein
LGLPLLHISFKYRSNRQPVVVKGLIAIGRFACGVCPLYQFGEGFVSVSQFTIAGYAFAQFAIAYSLSLKLKVKSTKATANSEECGRIVETDRRVIRASHISEAPEDSQFDLNTGPLYVINYVDREG